MFILNATIAIQRGLNHGPLNECLWQDGVEDTHSELNGTCAFGPGNGDGFGPVVSANWHYQR